MTVGSDPSSNIARRPPDNPWFPGALISALFPLLGLLTVRDGRDRRRLAWTVFAAVVLAHVVLRLLYHLAGSSSAGGESALGTIFRALEYLLMFVGGAFGLIYTHDQVVRSYPHLGTPILFLRAVDGE